MRRFSETYNAARMRGDKPFILAFVFSNLGCHVVGKETPTGDHVTGTPYNIIDWSARVLSFGTFRKSLSENSNNILQTLSQTEMSSYTLTCDNADEYFTNLLAREELIGQQLLIFQGYFDSSFADLQPLFNGIIQSVEMSTLSIQISANQAVKNTEPDDPTINTETLYSMRNPGIGNTGAEESFTYAELQDAFYTEDYWVLTTTFVVDDLGVDQHILEIENDAYGNTRLLVGLDSDNHPYIYWNSASPSAPQDLRAITFDGITINQQELSQLTFTMDPASASITCRDFYLNSDVQPLPALLTFNSKYGSPGSGNDNLDDPTGIVILNNFLYICDFGNNRIVKRDTDLNFVALYNLTDFTGQLPIDICTDGDYFYVYEVYEDTINKVNIAKYTLTFTLVDSVYLFDGVTGGGICTDGTFLYTADNNNDKIRKHNTSLTFIDDVGSFGSGDDQFNAPFGVDTDGVHLYIADSVNDRVNVRDLDLIFVKNINIATTPGNLIKQIKLAPLFFYGGFSTEIRYIGYTGQELYEFGTSGSGDGQFQGVQGIALDSNNKLYICDTGNDRIQKFNQDVSLMNTDDEGNDTLIIGKDFGGGGLGDGGGIYKIITSTLAGIPLSIFQNIDNDNLLTDFPELIQGLDTALVDGVWEEFGEIEEIISTTSVEDGVEALTEIIMPTAGRYADPGENQQNVNLPLVYGDMTENSDEAVWTAPGIDTVNFVYCVSGWPLLSVANGNVVTVYVDGVETPSGWVFDESNDYESQGNIAILDFASDPGGVVTVRCKGKDDGGTLITNPISVIDDFLDYVATLLDVTWQKGQRSFSDATNAADQNGYTCAGIILSNNTLGYWLQNILNSFLGWFNFAEDGTLDVYLRPLSITPKIVEEVQEYNAIHYDIQKSIANVCNRLIIDYALSSADVDRRFKNNALTSYFRTADEVSEGQSVGIYGDRKWSLAFDWTRNTATVDTIIAAIFDFYRFPDWILNYSGQDTKFLILDLYDHIEGSFSLLRDNNGEVQENTIFELRGLEINLDNFQAQLQLLSLISLYEVFFESTGLLFLTSNEAKINVRREF